MVRKYPKYFLAMVMLFALSLSYTKAQVTTVGKEFWFGFMENFSDASNGVAVIMISANEAAQGTIDLSGFSPGLTYNFDLQAGENYTLRVPVGQEDLLHRTSGQIENKGIFVSSSGNISVYAFNERIRSADGTVILPIPTLGKEYYVTSHFEIGPNVNQPGVNLNENNESLLLVVGTENNTRVEITPTSNTVDGKAANVPFEITLNEGQTYQLKARGDLSGSRIRVVGDQVEDCKNIAVFGGNKWTGVGECGLANDHLFQQTYPTNTWGTDFIHVPLKGRSSGELVKVMASEDNTQVTVDGNVVGTLSRGEYLSLDFGPNEIRSIQTSEPSDVTVFSKSQACNDGNADFFNVGDPFMISYSPNQQLLKEITFEAMDIVAIENNYVNIIVSTASAGQTILDGNSLAGGFLPVPSNPDFSYARVDISSGTHTLRNPDGFIAYVYGFGYVESYGYSAGASLGNLNFEVYSTYEFDEEENQVACLNEEATWVIEPENPLFTYFTWDFGDGSDLVEGTEVFHTYDTPGTYTVEVSAAINPSTCEQQENVVFEVEVKETSGQLEGIQTVCPMEEGLVYHLKETENIDQVEWEITGGEIVESDELSITVNWFNANPNAEIRAIPFTQDGCPGEPIRLGVNINPQLDPDLPLGQDTICFDSEEIYSYEAPDPLPSRKYEWHIDGGTIVSGADEPTVEVVWDTPGITGEIWYEEMSVSGDFCSGISDALLVVVNEALVVNTILTDVSCFGNPSGTIFLEVSGGSPPYTFDWSHDSQLSQNEAQNLSAGIYEVTVTDDSGCVVNLDEMEIQEPTELAVTVESVEGTSCFGREDGRAQLKISGGTAPYSVDHELATVQGDEVYLSDLPAGSYELTVIDQQNCQFIVSFEVGSPDPLDVQIEVVQRACPGGSNGILRAIPEGGAPPFEYTWDYETTAGDMIEGIPAGNYSVTVIDQNNCISFGEGQLLEEAPKVRMPTGFYPESDGVNAVFQPISNCALEYKLSIISRWGELIFNGSQGWDGWLDGKTAPPGTYTYLLEYSYEIGGETYVEQERGMVTLIR